MKTYVLLNAEKWFSILQYFIGSQTKNPSTAASVLFYSHDII